jgi:hypothetical protein
MKRSEALAKIRHCGYFGKLDEAALIAGKKNIGKMSARSAFLGGERIRKRGDSCNCPECSKKGG